MYGGADNVDVSNNEDLDDSDTQDAEFHHDIVNFKPVEPNKRKFKGGQARNRKKTKVAEQRDRSADWTDEQKEADRSEATDKLESLVGETVSVYGS